MRITTLPRILLFLTLAAASTVAYNGASGGGITITYPTAGVVLDQGKAVAITWTTSGFTSPLVAIKLVTLTNGVPDDSNAISIAELVKTSDQAYSWTVAKSFSGENVISISGIGSTAYSPSFTVNAAPSANTTSLPPTSSLANTTTSSLPNSTSPTLQSTLPPSYTNLPSASSTTPTSTPTTSIASANTSSPFPSSPSSSSIPSGAPIVAAASVAGVLVVVGAIYFALCRTRRRHRRRPISMPLISEQSEPDWQPPVWAHHNPPFRKPPAAEYAAAPSTYAGSAYAPSSVYNNNTHPYPPQTYAFAGSSWRNGPPAAVATTVAETSPSLMSAQAPATAAAATPTMPEEAYFDDKTAVANVGLKEETGGAPVGLEGANNKPNEKE